MVSKDRLIAFATITDAEKAKRFYADVLGLQLVADEPWALVLDAAGTMLRLQKVQEALPPQGTVLGVARLRHPLDYEDPRKPWGLVQPLRVASAR